MNLIKTVFPIFLIFFSIAVSVAQSKQLQTITENDLQRHVSFLASDSLQGRSFDTEIPGLDIAAGYLRSEAQKAGLEPLDRNYFQLVPVVSMKYDKTNSYLRIINQDNAEIYKTDSVLSLNQTEPVFGLKGEVVFAGFGMPNKKQEKSGDIEGKIVLFSNGSPEKYRKKTAGQ